MEQREGKLTGIGEIIDRNIVLKGADLLTAKGFTMVPNHLLISNKISPGSKLTYAMLGVDPIKPDTQRVGKGCTPGVSDSPAGNGDARCCSPPSSYR